MNASTRNDELAAVLIAVASGMLAALAGASPTGSAGVDAVLVAVSCGAVTWLAATGAPIVIGGTALVAGALSGSPWLAALGVVAFGAAAWVRRGRWQLSVGAGLALVTVNIAARSSLSLFLGAETLVGVTLAAVLVVAGLRSRSLRSRRIVAAVVALYAAVAIAGTAATASAGAQATDDVAAAERAVDRALDLAIGGDTDGARELIETAVARLSEFESSMTGPLTTGAVVVPVVAQHRDAALDVSRSASDALESIAREMDVFDLDDVMAAPGTVDLDTVSALERPMLEFQDALRTVDTTLAGVRSPWLLERVSGRLDELDRTVEEQMRRGDDALEVIRAAPALLGADEPRTYFLAFTTPAEVRGLSGYMGLYAEMTAVDGRIEMSRFRRADGLARDLAASDESSVITGPAEWLERYSRFGFAGPSSPPGTPLGTWGNVTMSPDSAATGEVIAQLYPSSGGRAVDGVFVVDVIAVSKLLDITGPIATSAGVTLDVENAEAFLLNEQYAFSDRPERADVLEEVARAVVDELLGSSVPAPREVLAALGPMVEQGRLVGWAADVEEQRFVESIGLDGGWPDSAEGDVVAVAFNNATGNKLDYFLRARAHYDVLVDATTATVRGSVTVEVENRPPPTPQPDYVMENLVDLPRGHNRTWVSVYTRVPASDLRVDGQEVTWQADTEAGFFVASTFVTMAPGDTPAIEVTLDGRVELADGGYQLTLWSPPTARTTPVTADVEVRHHDGSVTRSTSESRSGSASLLVPIPQAD